MDSNRSVDPTPGEYVYGRSFQPEGAFRDKALFQRTVEQSLYKTSNSILTVIAERQGESTDDVDLYNATNEQKRKIEDRVASSMLVVYEGQEGDENYARTDENLGPDKIKYVLLPKAIADSIPEGQLASSGAGIRVVDGKIKRSLYDGEAITMPDYEGEIKKLLVEENKPLWIHGVRLPTEADISN